MVSTKINIDLFQAFNEGQNNVKFYKVFDHNMMPDFFKDDQIGAVKVSKEDWNPDLKGKSVLVNSYTKLHTLIGKVEDCSFGNLHFRNKEESYLLEFSEVREIYLIVAKIEYL